MAAPIGNQNAIKAKRWSQAIDRALAERSRAKGIEALDELAEKLLVNCDEGDMTALKELGDRIEGKPAQSIDLTAEVTTRSASDLTDDQLAAIANASGQSQT